MMCNNRHACDPNAYLKIPRRGMQCWTQPVPPPWWAFIEPLLSMGSFSFEYLPFSMFVSKSPSPPLATAIHMHHEQKGIIHQVEKE